MRKIIKILLISFLTLNLSFTSFASDGQQGKAEYSEKPGNKIIPTESVEPVKKTEDPPKDSDKKDGDKSEDTQPDSGKKEETNPPKVNDSKNEDSAYKDKREKKENPAETKEGSSEKNPDMERLEKVVDDLVTKLDKNSNLSKALAEMQAQNTNTSNKDVSHKTEAVLKDYNKKIQSASSAKERRKLENEAAKKIQSISENKTTDKGVDSSDLKPSENIPEKKKKILLEVKPDKVEEEDDRNKILALNPTSEAEEEEIFFLENPIVIITLIFIIALVVAIGIVIRNNEKKEKHKSNK